MTTLESLICVGAMSGALAYREKQACLALTKKMLSRDLCASFTRPIDPVIDNAADYFEKIKSPMDLGTIKRKVETDSYRSVEEWIEDVERVWDNALRYNKEGSAMHLIALEMQRWFRRKVMATGWTPEEDIFIEVRKAVKALCLVAHQAPKLK